MAVILLVYGIVLAGLGVLLQQISPAFAGIAFLAAMIGGGLSLVWACISAFISQTRRTWPILTLIPVALTLLTQLVHSVFEGNMSLLPLLVLASMLFITMAMLMYLFHGERPPGFYDTDPAHPKNRPVNNISRP